MFKIAEKFVSINGEGRWSGELAVFIRFINCNLNCNYCDTKWVNDKEVEYKRLSIEDIISPQI